MNYETGNDLKRNKEKCSFPDGVIIKPNGEDELDPCLYEEIETHYNCMVKVLRCKKCGHIEWEWFRGDE